MIGACLRSNPRYLDISGEISVFEHAHSLAAEARQANVVLCPGVGFDVVPTDCVAVALKDALPAHVGIYTRYKNAYVADGPVWTQSARP